MPKLDDTYTFPTRVNIDEEGLTRLQDMLKTTYQRVTDEINTATDFGAYNRRQIQVQIKYWLESLNVDINSFLREQLPLFYQTGAEDAVRQLDKLGSEVQVAFSFNQINQRAIAALYSDASRSFADAINGVGRSAYTLLNQAVKRQITNEIAAGLTTGQALSKTTSLIKGVLQERGLTSLVDKGGRAWSLDDYATMLYQTKAAEARNLGLVNQMVANGYDLVQVSSHGATDVCADWEGAILSMTGATPTFNGEDVPTMDEAMADGLFHPNCRHTVNAIADTDLADKAYSYTGQQDADGNPIYAPGMSTGPFSPPQGYIADQ